MDIGKRITELRLLNEMKTVTALAKKSGLSQPYLSQIEKGERNCPIETLEIICRALNVTLEIFFRNEEITKKNLNYIKLIKKAENLGFSASTLNDIIESLGKATKKE
jgi:transcriptional regulator with XRE-family HTH domain